MLCCDIFLTDKGLNYDNSPKYGPKSDIMKLKRKRYDIEIMENQKDSNLL